MSVSVISVCVFVYVHPSMYHWVSGYHCTALFVYVQHTGAHLHCLPSGDGEGEATLVDVTNGGDDDGCGSTSDDDGCGSTAVDDG